MPSHYVDFIYYGFVIFKGSLVATNCPQNTGCRKQENCNIDRAGPRKILRRNEGFLSATDNIAKRKIGKKKTIG